jgi:2-dehydropantoate 2-reductase
VVVADLDTAGLSEPDIVLVCVKSFQTEQCVRAVAARVDDRVPFVSLQNGLNEDRIAAIVGRERTIGAVVRFEGALAGPGHAVQNKSNGPLSIGELDGVETDRIKSLAALLNQVIPTAVVADIWADLWAKLARNCMLNPVAAISGLGLSSMAGSEFAPLVAASIGREVAAVVAAQDISLPPEVFYKADQARLAAGDAAELDIAVDGFRALYAPQPDVRPSMLQDVLKGRESEIDFLNGEIASRGPGYSIATPVNDRVIELVHRIERGEISPSPELLAEAV